jgi:uncharacterized protein YgiM (DUF1202 family)
MWLAVVLSSGVLTGSLSAQTPPAPQDAAPPIVPADTSAPPAAAKSDAKKNAKKSAPKKENPNATKAESAPVKSEPAVAMQKNVNVRGQANINSEIVTHLKQGELVTILDEVTLKSAKPDEPAKWARIALPAGTPVWVNAHFVDKNTKTVTANRLRIRSGPGENYSTLGMIEKGTVLKELETKGDWIKIESPAGAYAFVAAHLLSRNPADVAPALARANPPPAPAPATTAPPAATTTPPATPAPPIPTAAPPPTVVVNQPPPVTAPVETIQAPAPAPVTAPSAVTAPPVTTAPATATMPAAPLPSDEPLPKRVVTREGIVRGSASIQAPSYYVLRSLDNNKTINYLHSPTTNIVLKEYQYQRVLVTGEELLDERWPHTPVIDIETIQTVP